MMSPVPTDCSAGTTVVALGRPPLSIASQLYQPPRPAPICAIHGHTASGGASMVMAWVEVKIGSGTIASTGSGRRFSNPVAAQEVTVAEPKPRVPIRPLRIRRRRHDFRVVTT